MTLFHFFYVSSILSPGVVICKVKPAPPETKFFLYDEEGTIPKQVVHFTNSASIRPQTLCVKYESGSRSNSNLDLLAFKLCKEKGYASALNNKFLDPENFTDLSHSSSIVCSQEEDYEINCSRSVESYVPCKILQVDCGPCHASFILKPNSSVRFGSPLYPILQPGLVCQYDFHLPKDINAELSLEILDLSLPVGFMSTEGHHCIDSFLHILSGQAKNSLKSVATLCGDIRYPFESRLFKLGSSSIVKFMLVTGKASKVVGMRGFLSTVRVSPKISSLHRYKTILLGSGFGFSLFLCTILVIVILYLRRRNEKQASVSPANWEIDNNSYRSDNTMKRRSLPRLPDVEIGQVTIDDDGQDLGYKIYESLGSVCSYSSSNRTVLNKKNCTNASRSLSCNTDGYYATPLFHKNEKEEIVSLTGPPPSLTESNLSDNRESCIGAQDYRMQTEKLAVHRPHLSSLMQRIRSISMTEPMDDETDLLGNVSADGDDVFTY